MKNRIGVTSLAAAAIASTLLTALPATPANAEDPQADHRPCVSLREFRGAWADQFTRKQLEERWDVRGLGSPVPPPLDIFPDPQVTLAYPRCGYALEDAWYSATYSGQRKRMVALGKYRRDGVLPHGHPRG